MIGIFVDSNNTRPEESYIRNLSDEAQREWVVNIIDRMCKAYQLEGKGLKGQLTERLGVGPSTIKGWLFNRRIPYHAMVTCFKDTGVNLIWLLDGKHPDLEITNDTETLLREKVVEHLFAAQNYQLLNTPDGINMIANKIIEDVKSALGISISKI